MKINKPAAELNIQNFLNNEWTKASGKPLEVTSPYFGNVVGSITESTSADLDKVVKSATEAQKDWAAKPIKERTQVMFNLREVLLNDIEKISEVVSLENGKTFAESRAGIMKGIEVLEFAIGIQNLDLGGKLEVSRGVFCEYRRKPVGVVANITPFNFPAMVPMWTLPIAIVLGNSYIWKPSEKTPLTSYYIAEAFKKAGLPAGVLSVVQGGKEIVEAILDHKGINAVGFVGSSKVAQLVYERGAKNGKRTLALGGAKNHIILLPDANEELTGKGISDSFTGCAGQRCMAASVLLAVGDCDAHISKIKERAESMELGNTMGAIITKEQVEFLNQAIEKAVSEGATLVLDGRNPKVSTEYEGGYWLGPTILDNVKPEMEAATRELFGPVLSIIRCKSISDAIKIENNNPYGNACSVFTSSGPLAETVISQASAGMIGVNIGVPVPREPFSFGGINYSKFGHGDITGHHSLDFWTDVRKITTKWEKQTDENWMS